MPTCWTCGTAAADGTHFCPTCGASLTAPAPAPTGTRTSWTYRYPYGPSRSLPQTNGMAVASLVVGILWLFWIGSILALVFGYVGKGQIDRSAGAQSGRGLAIAGIVLGWVGIGFLVLIIVVAIVSASTDSGSSQQTLSLALG